MPLVSRPWSLKVGWFGPHLAFQSALYWIVWCYQLDHCGWDQYIQNMYSCKKIKVLCNIQCTIVFCSNCLYIERSKVRKKGQKRISLSGKARGPPVW